MPRSSLIIALLLSAAGLRATDTPTPTVTRTATRTQTSTVTPTRSPTRTITATATPTIVSNLSLYKQAYPTVVVSGQSVQYYLNWTLNSFPGPTPSYIEIVDTLPAGFSFSGVATITPWPSPTPGGPTPVPTAALCGLTVTGNVVSARWCGPSTGEYQSLVIFGTVSGPMGSTLWNLFSGASDSGWATTFSQPEPIHFATATPTTTVLVNSPTLTSTRTASPYLSSTPTSTQTPDLGTPTPIPAADSAIDDFEDGDFNTTHGGVWSGTSDSGGSSVLILPAGGCPDGTAGNSCNAQGSCSGVTGGQYAGVSLSYGGGGIDLTAATGYHRLLGFKAYSATPLTITVRVNGALGGSCEVEVYLDGNGWQNCTVALPNHEAPGDLPQLSGGIWSLIAGGCTGIDFHCTRSTAGTTPFDFRIDDVQWNGYPRNNRTRVLAFCGCTQADLDEAYSYGLTEEATWLLLVIRQHCGCRPHDIMALRTTMSWGQICTNYGLDWATIVDEAWDLAEGLGLQPDGGSAEQVLRVLQNNALPTPVPAPTSTPYVPTGPLPLPAPGGC